MASERLPDWNDRFWSKAHPEPMGGCWLWIGALNSHGYGVSSVVSDGVRRQRMAHRVSFERVRGPIPAGLVIDHLCRVRSCVNPHHLRAVTNLENLLCGETNIAINLAKTHCLRGHELAGENLYVTPKRGRRQCRACGRIRWHHSQERKSHVA